MFMPSTDVGELIARVLIVYAFLLILLRFIGKKHVGELAPFDLVVLLILSECVQGSLTAGDNSLTGGLSAVATLFAANQLVDYVAWRSKRAERTLEGTPRILVRNGRVYRAVMARERITNSELLEAVRKAGCTSISKVRYAVLENDGNITVGLRGESS